MSQASAAQEKQTLINCKAGGRFDCDINSWDVWPVNQVFEV